MSKTTQRRRRASSDRPARGETHLRSGASPGLHPDHAAAVDGFPIGPKNGSCGTAAFRREPVLAAGIPSDPLWKDHADFVRPFGYRLLGDTHPVLPGQGAGRVRPLCDERRPADGGTA